MRTIVHLSDLHFGSVDQSMLQPLILEVWKNKPDLVAVSGDLTQRAQVRQFKEAKSFLESLPKPQVVVPGNHDIPLCNLVLRFLWPLARFKRYITKDLSPLYIDSEIAVLGVNTTRALVAKGGRINIEQVENVCRLFLGLQGNQTRIVVTHHPFSVPEGFSGEGLVGRSSMAMESFSRCGVDLFLSGHLHTAYAGNTSRYMIKGFSALVVEAGTVISTRGRGELNSYNIIRISPPRLSVEVNTWKPDRRRFLGSRIRHFRKSKDGWISVQPDET